MLSQCVCYGEILIFYHLFTNRNQLNDEDDLSLSPENVARQLGSSDEAEPNGIKGEDQKMETDQSPRQECGYAMLTPRTTVVMSNRVSIY